MIEWRRISDLYGTAAELLRNIDLSNYGKIFVIAQSFCRGKEISAGKIKRIIYHDDLSVVIHQRADFVYQSHRIVQQIDRAFGSLTEKRRIEDDRIK